MAGGCERVMKLSVYIEVTQGSCKSRGGEKQHNLFRIGRKYISNVMEVQKELDARTCLIRSFSDSSCRF